MRHGQYIHLTRDSLTHVYSRRRGSGGGVADMRDACVAGKVISQRSRILENLGSQAVALHLIQASALAHRDTSSILTTLAFQHS